MPEMSRRTLTAAHSPRHGAVHRWTFAAAPSISSHHLVDRGARGGWKGKEILTVISERIRKVTREMSVFEKESPNAVLARHITKWQQSKAQRTMSPSPAATTESPLTNDRPTDDSAEYAASAERGDCAMTRVIHEGRYGFSHGGKSEQ
jgi:hypothetical protein